MQITGKNNLILTISLLSILSTFGLVTYVFEDSGIRYAVDLESIGSDNVDVWGRITLKITNNRDSPVEFTDVTIELENPDTSEIFYTYQNAGGRLEPTKSITHSISFRIPISDIPETNIVVNVTGWLLWDGDLSEQSRTFLVPVKLEI